jgi:hypothetical protein
MHPSHAGRPQAVAVCPRRTPAPRPRARAIVVPTGFRLTLAPKCTSTYVLVEVATSRRTVFTVQPGALQQALHREAALLRRRADETVRDNGTVAAKTRQGGTGLRRRGRGHQTGTGHRKPRIRRDPNNPHPNTLPEEHPRAVAWRQKIQAGMRLAKALGPRRMRTPQERHQDHHQDHHAAGGAT